MTIIISSVDSEEFQHHFDAQEISIICLQICEHIIDLFDLYQKDKPPSEHTRIDRFYLDLQIRLGILGRIATVDINDDPEVKVHEIVFMTSTIDGNDELKTKAHMHDLCVSHFSGLSPMVYLDFMLVLLEESTKGILATMPERSSYSKYGRESANAFRDIVSDLRTFAKDRDLLRPDPNMFFASLLLKVEIHRYKNSDSK